MAQRVIPVAITAEYVGGDGVTLGAAGSHSSVVLEYDFRAAGPQWEGTTKYVLWTNPQGNSTNRVNLGVDKLVEGYDGKVYHDCPTADAMCVAGWAEMVVVGVTVNNGVETVKIKTEPSRFRVLPATGRASDNEGIAATVADQLQTEIEVVDSRKVNKPISPYDPDGVRGQFLMSRGNGKTEWVDMDQDVIEEVLLKHKDWVTTVQPGGVDTRHLKDGAVSEDKLADGAVTADKLADGAVTGDKLAEDAVTAEHLADGAVTTSAIEDQAVTENKLEADTAKKLLRSYWGFSSPGWATSYTQGGAVQASYDRTYVDLKQDDTLTGGEYVSEPLFLALPHPLRAISLTGSATVVRVTQVPAEDPAEEPEIVTEDLLTGAYLAEIDPIVQDQRTMKAVSARKITVETDEATGEETLKTEYPAAAAVRFRVIVPEPDILIDPEAETETESEPGSEDADEPVPHIFITLRFQLSGKVGNPPGQTELYPSEYRWDMQRYAKGYVESREDPATSTSIYADNRRYAYGRNWLYDNPPHLINNANGEAMMECDTFMQMLLRGIDYNHSPYHLNKIPSATIEHEDLPNNPEDWWAVRQMVRNLEGGYPDWDTAADVLGKWLRYAPDLAWLGWYQQSVFYDRGYAKAGDFAFYAKPESGTGFAAISHIAVMYWEDDEWYIYEATTADNSDGRIVQRVRLAERDQTRRPVFYARLIHLYGQYTDGPDDADQPDEG